MNCSLHIDQSHFINHVLSCFGITDCKPVSSPLDSSIILTNDRGNIVTEMINQDANFLTPSEDGNSLTKSDTHHNLDQSVNSTLFRWIVGSLMFLMITIHPDLAVSVSMISQFATNPLNIHV